MAQSDLATNKASERSSFKSNVSANAEGTTLAGLPLEIVVKEIAVKQCLQNTTQVNDPVMLVALLCVGAVYPIQNVECTVSTHEEDIVPCKILNFTVTLQNNELWENGDGFQINRKCPEQLQQVEILGSAPNQMRYQRYHSTRRNCEPPVQESILGLVIR